jgi:hypothetical protein
MTAREQLAASARHRRRARRGAHRHRHETLTWRAAALLLGGLYAVAVAASRVYPGDHYPVDVLGGMLCALAAAFIVTGLTALPSVAGAFPTADPRSRGQGNVPGSAWVTSEPRCRGYGHPVIRGRVRRAARR